MKLASISSLEINKIIFVEYLEALDIQNKELYQIMTVSYGS